MDLEQDNKDKVRPVSADGIQEFDNQLPTWWVGLFYLTIVVGIAYGLYKYTFHGESLIEAYNSEIAVPTAPATAASGSAPSDTGEAVAAGPLSERVKEPDMIAAGKLIFSTYCVPCHGQDGGGTIGPNLTDHYFLHGNTPDQVVAVIANGVLEKGMASWKPTLGQAKVEQAAAYVLSLIGTTPQVPKAPQGDLIP
jgi:cytochrome c oxidase cbb3-type subunit 3